MLYFDSPYSFDYTIFKKFKRLHKKEYDIINAVCAFDIETSNMPEQEFSFMYEWAFQIEDKTVCGRTWDDFRYFLYTILQNIRTDGIKDRLIIFVHNLSFEFSYLKTVFDFEPDDVMIVKSRKVLRCILEDCIEFRCSYLHSNDSLENFAKKYNAKHKKLVGGLDYSIVRYPWTHLSKKEWKYCIYDVISLVEAIKNEMESDGDSLSTIPFTSTGYVRRDVREALRSYRKSLIEPLMPDAELYNILRDAFRGGDTHANRFYVGIVLNDVFSSDRSSSYPDVQVCDKFPVTKFKKVRNPSATKLREYLKKGKAIVFRVRFSNISLSDDFWGFPYLPIHKCIIQGDYIADNGRILEADLLETAITDIDFKNIAETYLWDNMEIIEMWLSSYGDLPLPLKETIINYFRMKTDLKDVEGMEIPYMKSKNKINGIYGMSAQDPGKNDFIFNYTETFIKDGGFIRGDSPVEERLNNTRPRMVMPYQWGVWTTAWARWYLYQAQKIAGHDGVYCDTDCVKSLVPLDLSEYNNYQKEQSKKYGSYALDRKGKEHFTGVMESEGKCERFLTWGAKKYAYEKDGKLAITIAGVNKKKGAEELRKKGLDALKPGFVFNIAGGLETKYNDYPAYHKEIDGHDLEITSNVYLYQSTYKLSITTEYENLLEKMCILIAERFKK